MNARGLCLVLARTPAEQKRLGLVDNAITALEMCREANRIAQQHCDALMEAFLDGTLDFEGHGITFREEEMGGASSRWLLVDGVCTLPQSKHGVRKKVG